MVFVYTLAWLPIEAASPPNTTLQAFCFLNPHRKAAACDSSQAPIYVSKFPLAAAPCLHLWDAGLSKSAAPMPPLTLKDCARRYQQKSALKRICVRAQPIRLWTLLHKDLVTWQYGKPLAVVADLNNDCRCREGDLS